jgi:t-SNARE complex subunit (syntaxin)
MPAYPSRSKAGETLAREHEMDRTAIVGILVLIIAAVIAVVFHVVG